ncbi:MAG: acyl-CoA dehydrogenase C-terminal domain-containing protein [Oceanobacter sp.]
MPDYKAPLRDMTFVMNELLDFPAHYARIPEYAETATPDMMAAILTEGARFCEQELVPLNRVGDEQGCSRSDDGIVTTPEGFKEAYRLFVESGWPSLSHDPEYGGQGLPESLGIPISEMMGSANWAWSMYPDLSHGAMNTIELHGTDDQKAIYLPRLVSGEWTGTMCLTEAHCGSDLGTLKTRAEPNSDGSYRLNGTKIFISAGEHDMADNIVHIVLARLPGAPEGTKGISLFIVPKFLPNEAGEPDQRNSVSCGAIEHKMGIHGNATCVMNFDDATGFLIGPENKGLNCMFTFMNTARIGTALQGSSAMEASLQGALAYAKERTAMRSLTGTKAPEKSADPIIVHPDVRRMLLTQKALSEGIRALIYYAAQLNDLVKKSTSEEERQAADTLLGFLTPIAKAFVTEAGCESTNLGMQVFGGHGYIAEWGMEQLVRDTRISTIYEGTTGIQALDLLGRKVLMTQGESLKAFTKLIYLFCKEESEEPDMAEFIEPLSRYNKAWLDNTMKIGMAAMKNRDAVGAASVDYLMYSGYISLAFFWARMAKVAQSQLVAGSSEKDFYLAKVQTARFYFARILPKALGHEAIMLSDVDTLMDMPESFYGMSL